MRHHDDIMDELAARGLLDLAHEVCRAHACSVRYALTGGRHRAAVLARRSLWHALRHTTPLSYPEIAHIFGVDHTSVMAGVACIQDRLARARPLVLPDVPDLDTRGVA